jgi:ADP-ribose pyrophosphatase
MIKTIKENIVMDNGFVKVYNNTVEFPDNTIGSYYKTTLSDKLPNYGVAGIAITRDNKIILMDNYRYAHSDFSIETVKGFGMHNKTALETFKIEMLEEIGFESNDVEEVLKLRESNSDYFAHCFVAKNCTSIGKTAHEDTEIIENIKEVDFKEAIRMIKNGNITDPLTIVLIQHVVINIL